MLLLCIINVLNVINVPVVRDPESFAALRAYSIGRVY